MMKYFLVCAALALLVEARIEVPGLENIQKCHPRDSDCIRMLITEVTHAVSKPYAPYNIRGFDPVYVPQVSFINDDFSIDMHLTNVTVNGFGDTAFVKANFSSSVNTVVLEHNFSFTGTNRVVYRLNPDVERQSSTAGQFTGVRSTVEYPVTVEVREDGLQYWVFGQETVTKVELPNPPVFNEEFLAVLVSAPEAQDLLDRVLADPNAFYLPVTENLINKMVPQIFDALRKFYLNVPMSEVVSV